MFKPKPTKKLTLQDEIDTLLTLLDTKAVYDEEYAKITDQLVKLYPLLDTKTKKGISPDTLVVAAANLLGIVLIIHHERVNVISSKALNFVQKLQ